MRNQVGEDLTANREAWMRERAGRRGATMLAPLLGVLAVLAVAVAAFAIVLRMQEHERLVGKERELALAMIATSVQAQEPRQIPGGGVTAQSYGTGPEAFAMANSLETRLAYVITGERQVDDVSRAGMIGLLRGP